MRLIDMVRTGRFSIHPDVRGTLQQLSVDMISLANTAVPIEITNVVNWLRVDWYPHGKTVIDVMEQFVDIRPSFPVAWFEYNKGDACGRRAMCCVVDDAGDWIVILTDQAARQRMPSVAQAALIKFPSGSGQISFAYNPDEPQGEESLGFLVANGAVPALMAQTLMHCKNISIVPEPQQPKLVKKFTRNHGTPPSSFRTIVIDPMKTAIRAVECIGNTEAAAKQRMHVIRGHYKTYTPERKLFGKVSGRFFFSAHVAGDPTLGVIQSDYLVKAQEGSTQAQQSETEVPDIEDYDPP